MKKFIKFILRPVTRRALDRVYRRVGVQVDEQIAPIFALLQKEAYAEISDSKQTVAGIKTELLALKNTVSVIHKSWELMPTQNEVRNLIAASIKEDPGIESLYERINVLEGKIDEVVSESIVIEKVKEARPQQSGIDQEVPLYQLLEGSSGHKILALAAPTMTNAVLAREMWQFHELQIIEMAAQRGGMALDVGASLGLRTLAMARIFQNVVAFEPRTDVANLLSINISLNGYSNVQVIRSAVLENDGFAYLLDENITNSHHAKDGILAGQPESGLENLCYSLLQTGKLPQRVGLVPALKLDSQDFRDVSLFRIDVGRSAENVLVGALSLIKAERPKILIRFDSIDFQADSGLSERIGVILEPEGYSLTSIPEVDGHSFITLAESL